MASGSRQKPPEAPGFSRGVAHSMPGCLVSFCAKETPPSQSGKAEFCFQAQVSSIPRTQRCVKVRACLFTTKRRSFRDLKNL